MALNAMTVVLFDGQDQRLEPGIELELLSDGVPIARAATDARGAVRFALPPGVGALALRLARSEGNWRAQGA